MDKTMIGGRRTENANHIQRPPCSDRAITHESEITFVLKQIDYITALSKFQQFFPYCNCKK